MHAAYLFIPHVNDATHMQQMSSAVAAVAVVGGGWLVGQRPSRAKLPSKGAVEIELWQVSGAVQGLGGQHLCVPTTLKLVPYTTAMAAAAGRGQSRGLVGLAALQACICTRGWGLCLGP